MDVSEDFSQLGRENRMATLKESSKNRIGQVHVNLRTSPATITSAAGADARFKQQLKRAVDSVAAPQYLIDAIKKAIRS